MVKGSLLLALSEEKTTADSQYQSLVEMPYCELSCLRTLKQAKNIERLQDLNSGVEIAN